MKCWDQIENSHYSLNLAASLNLRNEKVLTEAIR